LEAYYAAMLIAYGLREQRVNSPEVQGRMRTLINELVIAKKHYLKNHK
jgi:hypothetical protein